MMAWSIPLRLMVGVTVAGGNIGEYWMWYVLVWAGVVMEVSRKIQHEHRRYSGIMLKTLRVFLLMLFSILAATLLIYSKKETLLDKNEKPKLFSKDSLRKVIGNGDDSRNNILTVDLEGYLVLYGTNYLKEIQPDLVLINNFLFHLTPSVFNACKKFNIPVIMYIHDPRLFCPGGMLAYSDKYCYKELCIKGNPIYCIKNRCKISSLKASIIAALNFIFVRNQNLFNKCHSIICLSEALKNLVIKAGAPAEKIKIINHFIEDEKLLTEPDYKNENYFLYVGRLDREKGVHFLIEAMKNISSDIQLHIVGEGYEKENLILQSLGTDNIKFLGHLSGQALQEEYKNCIATVLPCNWFESFGLTNIESFVYGKPVIASNIAAIPEIIDDGLNGILVPPTDIKALSTAIEKLYYNPELVIELGKNARKKAEEKYTFQIYYEKIIEVFNSK